MYPCVRTKINIKCHEATETPVFLLVCRTLHSESKCVLGHVTGLVAAPSSPRLPSSSVSTHHDEAVASGRLRFLLCFSTGAWLSISRVPPTSTPVPVTTAPALPDKLPCALQPGSGAHQIEAPRQVAKTRTGSKNIKLKASGNSRGLSARGGVGEDRGVSLQNRVGYT